CHRSLLLVQNQLSLARDAQAVSRAVVLDHQFVATTEQFAAAIDKFPGRLPGTVKGGHYRFPRPFLVSPSTIDHGPRSVSPALYLTLLVNFNRQRKRIRNEIERSPERRFRRAGNTGRGWAGDGGLLGGPGLIAYQAGSVAGREMVPGSASPEGGTPLRPEIAATSNRGHGRMK